MTQGEAAGPRSALGRDVVVSTGGLLVTRGFTSVGGVLAARLLGPAGRGEYALVMFGVLAVGTAATLGIEYWVTPALAQGDDEATVRAVIRQQCNRVALLTTTVAAFALAVWFAVRGDAPVAAVLGSAGFVVANVVSMLALAVVTGRRQMMRASVAQALGAGSYAAMVAALLVTHHKSVGLVVVAAAVSTFVLAGAAVTRSSARTSPPAASKVRDARRVGIPAMVGEVATLGVYRLDLAVVALLLSPAAVGRYAVASSLAELLWIVPNAVTLVLMPQVARDTRGNATAPLVLVSSLVGLCSALVLTLLGAKLLTPVFGRGFAPAVDALPWLCVAAVVLGAWKLLLADLAGRGNTRVRATTALSAAGVMLVLDFILIPVWGIGGAGMASLVAYVVAFTMAARAWRGASGHQLRRLTDVSTAWRLVAVSGRPAPRS